MKVFRCVPHGGVRLSRTSCAARHESAVEKYGPGHQRSGKVFSELCSNCLVGAAHLRGESPTAWADGTRVHELALLPVGALLRSEPARRKARRVPAAVFG